jgi:hypothetical protein
MPNVLILPRSADYSEEVWAEIRSKAASVLRSFFAADDDDEDTPWAEEGATKPDRSDPSKRGGTGPTQPSAPAQDFRSKQQQLYYQA